MLPKPPEGRLEVFPHFIVVAVDVGEVSFSDFPPLGLTVIEIPLVTKGDHALVATPGNGKRGSGLILRSLDDFENSKSRYQLRQSTWK